MKKTLLLLSNLLLSFALFWDVPTVGGQEIGAGDALVVKVPPDTSSYCHMKFPPMREGTLSWERSPLNENAGHIIVLYGPCDYDPVGRDEIRAQRALRFDHGE
jgi:hypothetical protein